jgi:hypothetical protein
MSACGSQGLRTPHLPETSLDKQTSATNKKDGQAGKLKTSTNLVRANSTLATSHCKHHRNIDVTFSSRSCGDFGKLHDVSVMCSHVLGRGSYNQLRRVSVSLQCHLKKNPDTLSEVHHHCLRV